MEIEQPSEQNLRLKKTTKKIKSGGGGIIIKIKKGQDGERGNIIKIFWSIEHLLDSMIYLSGWIIESRCYIYSTLDDLDLI